MLGADGKVASIAYRERLESMKLIEEFMVLANVAAAEALEKARTPLIYRVHDTPSKEKLYRLFRFPAHPEHQFRQGPGGAARHLQPHPGARPRARRMKR